MEPVTWRAVSLRSFLRSKLGRCPYCMRWSAVATTLAWLTVGLLAVFDAGSIALSAAVAVAFVFTILVSLHLGLFTKRALETVPDTVPTDRRRFLSAFVRVTGAVFAAAVFGRFFQRAYAQDTRNSFCANLCNALFLKGTVRGKCKSDGAQGIGICFEGTCLPSPQASQGFKPKTDPRTKIEALVSSGAGPSTLAGTFFHLVRRFQLGAAPANAIEAAAFPILGRASTQLQPVLSCAANRFESLSRDERSRLFGSLFERTGTDPISIEAIRTALAAELVTRSGICRIETAGRVRSFEHFDPIEGITVVEPTPWICRLNRRRTKDFITPGGGRLDISEYTPDELEQSCTLDGNGSLVCQTVLEPNCPGDQTDGVCLRVPSVAPGEKVTLEGFNFFDTRARVLLDSVSSSALREVPAHVCGDTRTPLTEIVGGVEKVVADSRVRDILTFEVPRDLPDDLYRLTVIVPNTTGGFPDKTEFFSLPTPVIRVAAPYSGRVRIRSERIFCRQDTGFEVLGEVIRVGADEVGIRMFAIPATFDGETSTAGSVQETDARFNGFDPGVFFGMSRTVFDGSGFDAVAIAILGHEIDSEAAYGDMLVGLEDLIVGVLVAVLAIVAVLSVGSAASAIGAALGAGLTYVYSLWAPADLIIEDAFVLNRSQLSELTSIAFSLPPAQAYRSPNGIDVEVSACDPSLGFSECTVPAKTPGRYSEIRGYRSGAQFSDYRITLVYERA